MFDRSMTLNAQMIIKQHLHQLNKNNLLAVDATVGNGFDLFFLANCPEIGRVVGFDIQPKAISNSYTKIKECPKQITLIQASHHLIKDYVTELIDIAMFNLGYLPQGNKNIVTCAETTFQALRQVLDQLAPMGICTVMTYPGHAEGQEEYDKMNQFLEENYFKDKYILRLSMEQTKSPCPQLLIIVNNDSSLKLNCNK